MFVSYVGIIANKKFNNILTYIHSEKSYYTHSDKLLKINEDGGSIN